MNEVLASRQYNQPVSELRGEKLSGKLKIPSLRELWNILKNGGKIDFEIEKEGFTPYDWIALDEISRKEEKERKEQEREIQNQSKRMKSKL